MDTYDIGKLNNRLSQQKLVSMGCSKEEQLERRLSAFNLLGKKKDNDPTAYFSNILKDKKEPSTLKSNLILRLGHQLKSTRTIENFLGKDVPLVDRSIMQLLAYKGNKKSVEKIDALVKGKRSTDPVKMAAVFAKAMISYRLQDNETVWPMIDAKKVESFRGIKAQDITKSTLPEAKAKTVLNDLRPEFIAVPLASKHAQHLICQNKSLNILMSEALVEGKFDFGCNGVIAAITESDDCPGGNFIKYHVLIDQGKNQKHHNVHLVTSSGRKLMQGTGRLVKGIFSFEVKALKYPGSTPVTFKANLDLHKNRVQLVEGKSGITARKSSKIVLGKMQQD